MNYLSREIETRFIHLRSSIHTIFFTYMLTQITSTGLIRFSSFLSLFSAAVKVYIPTRSVSTTPPSSPLPSPKSAQLVKKIRKTVEPHLSPTAAEEKRCQLNKPKFYVQYSVRTRCYILTQHVNFFVK